MAQRQTNGENVETYDYVKASYNQHHPPRVCLVKDAV